MDYTVVKGILTELVIELISNDKKVSLQEASEMYYKSNLPELLADDETGLYGDSPQYIYSLYKEGGVNNEK